MAPKKEASPPGRHVHGAACTRRPVARRFARRRDGTVRAPTPQLLARYAPLRAGCRATLQPAAAGAHLCACCAAAALSAGTRAGGRAASQRGARAARHAARARTHVACTHIAHASWRQMLLCPACRRVR
jgi:hypothetical protein